MRSILKSRYVIGSLVGGILGCAVMFVYLNVDPLERRVATADGFSRWSLWQIPFTAPAGALGAAAGIVVASFARVFGRRRVAG
jgi:hypothetical protein